MALRRRGLPVGSPPPMRAATVSSLMSLVKSLPRFASSAPFLCLIVAHFECPLISAKPPARETEARTLVAREYGVNPHPRHAQLGLDHGQKYADRARGEHH